MNIKEKQAAWLKKRKEEEEAAFKIGRQNYSAQKNKPKPQITEELPEINVYCPHCNTLLFLIGKPKDLIGREFRCLECLGSFVVCKQPGILSRIMDGLAQSYEEEQIQKEKNSKAWIGIVGFAIGAYIGLTRNRHK
jgi:hypothetical protein